jgi:hypothetical protein
VQKGSHEKQLKVQDKAAQKTPKEQEAQQKRPDRAITAQAIAAQAKVEAKARKQADRLKAKEAKKAQKQLERQSKATVMRPRGRPRKQPAAPVAATEGGGLEIGVVSNKAGSRSVGTITRSAKFRT